MLLSTRESLAENVTVLSMSTFPRSIRESCVFFAESVSMVSLLNLNRGEAAESADDNGGTVPLTVSAAGASWPETAL